MTGPLQVEPDGNAITAALDTAALALLKELPLQGAVVTGDAVFCQRALCQASGMAAARIRWPSKPTSRT